MIDEKLLEKEITSLIAQIDDDLEKRKLAYRKKLDEFNLSEKIKISTVEDKMLSDKDVLRLTSLKEAYVKTIEILETLKEKE